MREEETVVMIMMFLPFMGSKNHLYKEDVGVDPVKGEGEGDGGDDENVSPRHREEESPV